MNLSCMDIFGYETNADQEVHQNSVTKESKTALRRTAKQRYEGEHIFHISTMSTHPTFPW